MIIDFESRKSKIDLSGKYKKTSLSKCDTYLLVVTSDVHYEKCVNLCDSSLKLSEAILIDEEPSRQQLYFISFFWLCLAY
jgi:hypothetical protein